MGVGSASVVDYANTYPGTASHVNATGSVGDFEVVVDGSGATTLSLNFQTATTLDPRITFSRTSNATIVGSDGLIQYAPHNLLTYSEQFDNAAWAKRSGSTVNANTLIAPDGTLTADTQTNTDTTTNGTYIRKNGAFAADDTVYCASCYFKQGSRPIAAITMYSRLTSGSNLRVLYDLNAGTYTLSNIGSVSGGTAGMEYIGNGWWRVWASANMLTGLDTTGIQFTPSVWAIPSAIGSEYGYIWGAQLNEGALQPYYSTTVKNLLGYSQSFENAAWTKISSSIAASTVIGPFGFAGGEKLVEGTVSGTPYISENNVVNAGVPYTISVYAKESQQTPKRYVSLLFPSAQFGSNKRATFDLSAGTYVTTNSPDSASITPIGNGWYRCQVSATCVTSGTTNTQIRIATTYPDTLTPYTGDGTSGIYIFGAQLSDSASLDPYSYNPVAAPCTSTLPTTPLTKSNQALPPSIPKLSISAIRAQVLSPALI